MHFSCRLMYGNARFQIWVIPQDPIEEEFDKKSYRLKVAHPVTTHDSLLTQVIKKTHICFLCRGTDK